MIVNDKLVRVARRICAADDADAREEFDRITGLLRDLRKNLNYAAATRMEDSIKETYIRIHRLMENLEKFVEDSEELKRFRNHREFQRRLHEFLKEAVDDRCSDLLYHSTDNHGMIGDIYAGIYHLFDYCSTQKARFGG